MLLALSSTFASLELVLAYIVGDALRLRGWGHRSQTTMRINTICMWLKVVLGICKQPCRAHSHIKRVWPSTRVRRPWPGFVGSLSTLTVKMSRKLRTMSLDPVPRLRWPKNFVTMVTPGKRERRDRGSRIHRRTGSGKVSGIHMRNSYLHAVACLVSCSHASTLPVCSYCDSSLPSQWRAAWESVAMAGAWVLQ